MKNSILGSGEINPSIDVGLPEPAAPEAVEPLEASRVGGVIVGDTRTPDVTAGSNAVMSSLDRAAKWPNSLANSAQRFGYRDIAHRALHARGRRSRHLL